MLSPSYKNSSLSKHIEKITFRIEYVGFAFVVDSKERGKSFFLTATCLTEGKLVIWMFNFGEVERLYYS